MASNRHPLGLLLLLLLGHGAQAATHSGTDNPLARATHDNSHSFVLASDADFLAALIALYEDSLKASIVVQERAHDSKVKAYAARTASIHRNDLTRFRKLLARHGKNFKPDFHFEPRMPDLHNLAGMAADRYYLNGLSQLIATKIELAEFASGTVQSRTVKRLAQDIFEGKSKELAMLNQWAKRYGTN